MNKDNWKHRADNMRCKTCMWFCPKESAQNEPETESPNVCVAVINLGRCRRHAPTMNGYPVVFVNDWCGDHKLCENCFVESVRFEGRLATNADLEKLPRVR